MLHSLRYVYVTLRYIRYAILPLRYNRYIRYTRLVLKEHQRHPNL